MKQRTLILATVSVFLFIGSVAASCGLLYQSQREQEISRRAHGVIEQLDRLILNLRASESSERGYINTIDRSFLPPYQKAIGNIPNDLNGLAIATSDNPAQKAKFEQLATMIQRKLAWEEQVIFTCDHDGRASASALLREHSGLNQATKINQLVNEMQSTERVLLRERRTRVDYIRRALLVITFLLAGLGLASLVEAIQFHRKSVQLEKERQEALKKLENKNRELNELVMDLTQTRADLTKALTARTEFIANMSHELRTPLTGVLEATELALSMPLSQDLRELITIASNCGESLLAMVNDILDFSAMQSGHVKLQSVAFNVAETVRHALGPLVQKSEAHGLELEIEAANDIPLIVLGDSSRVCQVISNLVDNAIKFTPKGAVHVSMSLHSSGLSTVSIRFNVDDTGIGINPEHLTVMFNHFVQADNSSTRRYGGAGLGLAICKRLVELMDGTIEVSSSPGCGSRFTVILPFKRDLAVAVNSQAASQDFAPDQNLTQQKRQSLSGNFNR